MRRLDPRAVGFALAAPLLAVLFAFVVTSIVLIAAGDPVGETWRIILQAWQGVPGRRLLSNMFNEGSTLYLAAVAVAIGFRMNLFNIGVDGQYRLAAFVAAWLGAQLSLPAPLHVLVILLAAMASGALWAAIAGALKVYRGVSEVISTIMLNAIAGALIAYLLRQVAVPVAGSNNIGTEPLPESARVGGIPLIPGSSLDVYGLVFLALVVGVAYAVLLSRTRFGFDLRATGRNASAAAASGVDVKRMVLYAMLLSGATAGLVGMPILLGEAYSYSLNFQPGLGFTGIAVALLGRNNAVGMALAAMLFAYLDFATNPLQIRAGVSSDIVLIMQGVIVLAVVVAYELVRRYRIRLEQQRVAHELRETPGPAAPAPEGAPA